MGARNLTTHSRVLVIAVASLLAVVGFSSPLASQAPVVELPSEDLELAAEFGDVFRVGDGGAEWELLTSITSLAFDASGNLHITDVGPDGGDMRTLVADSRGELVRAFGRTGDGPGEFRAANSAVVLRDGTTVVPDYGHRAYHVFRPGASSTGWFGFLRGPGTSLPRRTSSPRWGGGLAPAAVAFFPFGGGRPAERCSAMSILRSA